jgi:hypothetical protein
MRHQTLLPILLVSLVSLSGCMSYTHTRSTPIGPETTSFRTFLMIGRANKIKTALKDAGYSRTVSVGALEGQGDSGMVTASGEALGEMIGTAARKSVTP